MTKQHHAILKLLGSNIKHCDRESEYLVYNVLNGHTAKIFLSGDDYLRLKNYDIYDTVIISCKSSTRPAPKRKSNLQVTWASRVVKDVKILYHFKKNFKELSFYEQQEIISFIGDPSYFESKENLNMFKILFNHYFEETRGEKTC